MSKVKEKTKKAAPAKQKAGTSSSKPKTTAVKKAAPSAPRKEKQQMTKQVPTKATEKPKGKISFKKEVTQKLLESKTKILHEVSSKVKSESNVLKFEIGDIYDIASSERERELTLTLGDRDREKLSEIEDALERIKDDSYGLCEECAEPIAENRLRALPFTRVCFECQSRNEREAKIKGRFEEDTGLGIMERSENDDEEF